MSGLGVVDERLGGCDQGAGAGEADPGEGPQAVLVEVGECVEGVVAAAMRVAGPGVEVLELAKSGAPAGAGPRAAITSGSVAMVCLRSKAMIVSAENSVVSLWHYCESCFPQLCHKLGRTLLPESRKYPSWWGSSPTRPLRDRCAL